MTASSRCQKWVLATLVCALGGACAGQPVQPDPAPARPAQVSPAPCGSPAFLIRIPAPGPDGPVARLRIHRRGEGMGADAQRSCVVGNGPARLVARGEAVELPIGADPLRAQRLEVDGHLYLIWIPPGGELAILDQSCFGWTFSADWLNPFAQGPDLAYCRAPEKPCRYGYVQAGPPGPVEDPLCADHLADGDSERRCVKRAAIRLASGSGTAAVAQLDERRLALAAGRSITAYVDIDPVLPPGHCIHPQLGLGGEQVGLAIGPGAHWAVSLGPDGHPEARIEDLHAAAMHGGVARFAALLTRGIPVDARSAIGKTPLHYAVERGRVEAARTLLARGADPNAPDAHRARALHYAAAIRALNHVGSMNRLGLGAELVALLIESGAEPDATDEEGRTALHRVVNLSAWDCRDAPDGETMFYAEASAMAAATAAALLDGGADLRARTPAGRTPLHLAAAAGNRTLVELLLARGADRTATDQAGKTPAALAEAGQYDEVVDLLSRS